MRVCPQPSPSRSGLSFEGAECGVLRVLAEPPCPAETNDFSVHAATIREHHIGEPSVAEVGSVVADGDDLA
jgi:hypothetical protein